MIITPLYGKAGISVLDNNELDIQVAQLADIARTSSDFGKIAQLAEKMQLDVDVSPNANAINVNQCK